MAVRTEPSLSRLYEDLKSHVRMLRGIAVQHKATNDLTAIAFQLLPELRDAQARFANIPAGMAAYAQQMEGDDGYDVVAEWSAMIAAVNDCVATLLAGIPRDAQGHVLDRKMDANGVVTKVQLTAQQKTAVGAKLDAIIATING